jgi:hypothetical protein
MIKIPSKKYNWLCVSNRTEPDTGQREDECPICFGTLLKTLRVVTPCGHVFHATCFNKITSKVCPMCRKILI